MLPDEVIFGAAMLPALSVALLAGLLSFLSPCVLPVAAPYLAYMGGVSVTDMADTRAARRKVLLAASFFVLGLSVVFLLQGMAASALGRQVLQWKGWLETAAGLTVMVFGAHFIGIFRLRFLDREARIDAGDRGGSALGAFVLGLAFAFGWTPCLGPILGAILTVAATQADIGQGAALLAAYAAGLGIPFLLLAAFFPRLTGLVALMKRHMGRIERISGLLLWTMGLMMLTGTFTEMSNWILNTFPVFQSFG